MSSIKLNLIWSDEFENVSGSAPNNKNWKFDTGGHGWGNQELQYYTSSRDNAFHDENSSLVIQAKYVSNSKENLAAWYGPAKFTSARLITKELFEFTYGRVDARIKVPNIKGIWAAIWLLGANNSYASWPDCGEIDIMEFIGGKKGVIYGSLHGPGYSHSNQKQKTGTYQPENYQEFISDFHVFSLAWEPNRIKWYVDGKEYFCVTSDQTAGNKWVFDKPFFIVLNLAIGGTWAGQPDSENNFPQQMLVDYIRVYEGKYPKSKVKVNLQHDIRSHHEKLP